MMFERRSSACPSPRSRDALRISSHRMRAPARPGGSRRSDPREADDDILARRGTIDDRWSGCLIASSSRMPETNHIVTLSPLWMVLPPSSASSERRSPQMQRRHMPADRLGHQAWRKGRDSPGACRLLVGELATDPRRRPTSSCTSCRCRRRSAGCSLPIGSRKSMFRVASRMRRRRDQVEAVASSSAARLSHRRLRRGRRLLPLGVALRFRMPRRVSSIDVADVDVGPVPSVVAILYRPVERRREHARGQLDRPPHPVERLAGGARPTPCYALADHAFHAREDLLERPRAPPASCAVIGLVHLDEAGSS